ncbi:MAG: response regulator transcription factor [Nocardioides sp.]
MTQISVVVVDDHPMFRAGLRTLVQEADGLALAGEAEDVGSAIAVCEETVPDVVLMDIKLAGSSGVEATRQITSTLPNVAVLMLTMLEDDTSVFAAMRAGARGYILKGATPDNIVRAIRTVAAGEVIFGATLARRMGHFFTAGRDGDAHPFPELTTRERDVLGHLADGRSNAEIAAALGLSEKTVRNNVSNIFAKLLVADRAAAVAKARTAGLGSAVTEPTEP